MSDVMSETVVAPRGSRPVLGRYHVGNAVVDGPAAKVDRRAMGIAVLGSLAEDGAASSLGLPDRVVLRTLAVSTGVPARADALAETSWGEDLPASWAEVVQGCVGRIRKTLGADVSETSPQGYHLVHHADHIGQQAVGRLSSMRRSVATRRAVNEVFDRPVWPPTWSCRRTCQSHTPP